MKVLLIGVGAAGNKAVLTVANTNEEITMDDIVLVNSTSKDIPAEYNGDTIILSPDDTGCGKERIRAKELVTTAIISGKFKVIADKADDYDFIAVVASSEGGTGSGSAPLIANYCIRKLGMNTHVFGFTGFEDDPRGMANTIEFFNELNEEMTVHCIRNSAFLKKTGRNDNAGTFKAERMANLELARRIRLIDGSMLNASDQNMDDTDIYKVVNTCGYITIGYSAFNGPLTDVSEFDKICEKMVFEDSGIKNSNPGQQRMAVIMNISPVSEDYIDTNFSVLKKAYGLPYEIFIHKQYDPNIEEFVAFISSGQMMPIDEVKEIAIRYQESSSDVNRNDDTFFNEISKIKDQVSNSRFDMSSHKRRTMSDEEFLKELQTKPSKKEEKKG